MDSYTKAPVNPPETVLFKITSPKQPIDFSGQWKNELGSTMDLKISGPTVTGTYTTAVSSNNTAITKPLVGTVADDLISFAVNWGTSITAWTGHGVLEKQGQNEVLKILTLWQMVVAVPDETDPQQQWKTLYSGSDIFGH
jgi:Avidin family